MTSSKASGGAYVKAESIPRLKVGERVLLQRDGHLPPLLGTVVEVGYSAVKIAWDDGAGSMVGKDWPLLLALERSI